MPVLWTRLDFAGVKSTKMSQMRKKTEEKGGSLMTNVAVKLLIPKAVDDFLRRQFRPHEEDVISEYQAAFIRSVKEMLRDDFPEVPAEVWLSLRNSAIPIPITAQMQEGLEEAAKERGMSINELIQQILAERVGIKSLEKGAPKK